MNLNPFNRAPKTVQVAIEYVAPVWIVLIQNPGQKNWIALRDPMRKISVQDEFGTVIKTRPAIQGFSHKADADAWVKQYLPEAVPVPAHKAKQVKTIVQSLNDSRTSNLRTQSV